ncbi:hypothetical protein SAMN05216368_104196 [Cryobacterium flavum]|uniref:Uncharacterized protein n=1 Tax=Cryobacterium flavum TaxID=1424659 RepID=A0A5E9FX43_9MICO|nr:MULTISPECIES: hypothetical protein [Cryobacterium]SDN21457.1 hypothetical protein SAMN05216368_104196 [Cryobacterium flavum]
MTRNKADKDGVYGRRDRPILTALDKLDEPPSLTTLHTLIQERLPRIDLPELLLDVAG